MQSRALRVVDGRPLSQEFGVGATASEIRKGRVVLRGDSVKDDSDGPGGDCDGTRADSLP